MEKERLEEIKNSLTIEQIQAYVDEFGAESFFLKSNILVCKTICHNPIGEGSHKLYYYDNTHLFRCYTECDTTFDIFELTIKIAKNANKKCSINEAIGIVLKFFNIQTDEYESDFSSLFKESEDWKIIERYGKNKNLREDEKIVELKTYDDSLLRHMPRPHIIPWEKEGILYDVYTNRGICYDPLEECIIIPHYDIDNNLVGVRGRTLIKDNEKFGKYRPAFVNGIMYNHPLGYNLYNINKSKNNIKAIKKAIIFEAEKSCLQYASFFGIESDISVAVCGSSFINYQFELLLSLGVSEIIIGFDKQFKKLGDEEWKHWTEKLKKINDKYGDRVLISFLFDTGDLLDYKDSPTDKGAEIFLKLFSNRIIL